MKLEERIPIGSVIVICPNCINDEGFQLYEAVTDVGRPIERYYALCRKCGHILPLKPKKKR